MACLSTKPTAEAEAECACAVQNDATDVFLILCNIGQITPKTGLQPETWSIGNMPAWFV